MTKNLLKKNIYWSDEDDGNFKLKEYYNYKYNSNNLLTEEKDVITVDNKFKTFYTLFKIYDENSKLVKEIFNDDYDTDNKLIEYKV